MSKINRLDDPTFTSSIGQTGNAVCLNDEPLNYLDIQENAGHTHIVDTVREDTGIKTQKPVSIANDVTGDRAKMQDSTIGEMNQLYQDSIQ
jgi:hypothetical protein